MHMIRVFRYNTVCISLSTTNGTMVVTIDAREFFFFLILGLKQ